MSSTIFINQLPQNGVTLTYSTAPSFGPTTFSLSGSDIIQVIDNTTSRSVRYHNGVVEGTAIVSNSLAAIKAAVQCLIDVTETSSGNTLTLNAGMIVQSDIIASGSGCRFRYQWSMAPAYYTVDETVAQVLALINNTAVDPGDAVLLGGPSQTITGPKVMNNILSLGALGKIDLNGVLNSLVFDADADTYLDPFTDDILKWVLGGGEILQMTANGLLSSLDGSGAQPPYGFLNSALGTGMWYDPGSGAINLTADGVDVFNAESGLVGTIMGVDYDNGMIKLADGAALTPALRFINDGDTGLFKSATGANRIGVSVGGHEGFIFTDGLGAGLSQLLSDNGSGNAPAYSFKTDINAGIWFDEAGGSLGVGGLVFNTGLGFVAGVRNEGIVVATGLSSISDPAYSLPDFVSGMYWDDPNAEAGITNAGTDNLRAGTDYTSIMGFKVNPTTSVEGPQLPRTTMVNYDFATDGGLIGTITLPITLPDGAVVTKAYYRVKTTFVSNAGADNATVALGIAVDDTVGIVAPIAINDGSNPWDAGYHDAIQDGTAANFSTETTAIRAFILTIAVENLDAGNLDLYCEYFIAA